MSLTCKTCATVVVMSLSCVAVGASAAGPAATIAPYLDDQSFAVVRVDIRGLDVAAAVRWLGHAVQAPPEEVAQVAGSVSAWRQNLLATGGREAYVVLSLADLPDHAPAFIIPVPSGADAEAIAAAVRKNIETPGSRPPRGGPFGGRGIVIVHDNVVIAGESQETVRRLQQVTPSPRAELEAAFAAAGSAPLQAVLVPSELQRRIIAETLPHLPEPLPPMSGEALSTAVRWAAASAQLPPTASLQVVVQSSDADAAAALKATVEAVLATAAGLLQSEGILPKAPKIAQRLAPTVRGSRVVLGIDPAAFKALEADLVQPLVEDVRENARGALALTRVRMIDTALRLYREEHNGQWPPDLQALIDAAFFEPEMLTGPSTDQRVMVYIRPPADASGMTVVVYEDPASHDRSSTAVGFLDGHAALMRADEGFRRLVEQAEQASKEAYGGATE